MHVIGLLGGVASGKSLVARELARLGAGLLDADRAGHEVLGTPRVEAAARARWGEAIFDPQGRIDRARLGRIVFAEEGAPDRKYLEELTHPEIARRLKAEAERLATEGYPAAVLDAPLLFEAGWDKLCDTLVFVDAPRPLRLARAQRRGWDENDLAAREGVQMSLDLKRARADVVLDNSQSPEHIRAQVERLWHGLVG